MSTRYKYLIIGGGMAADAALSAIRQHDAAGPVGLIGAEPELPYNRPPLSKGLWKGDPLESIWRKTETAGVELHLGRKARSIDPRSKHVADDQGGDYTYEMLLVATGGTPRQLTGDSGAIYYRTLRDYRQLRELCAGGDPRFAVIGGGFIGWEVAAALAMNGKRVTMIFPGQGIGSRMYPADLAAFLNDFYRQKGVEVVAGETVTFIEQRGKQVYIQTASELDFLVDGVVAGIGIHPNVELAEAAGLEVADGITVDEYLRTSDPHIYAAGDVASFLNPSLGRRLRVEHEDNANTMGRIAGENMTAAAQGRPSQSYSHLPFFYSDLFDLGYEAVGEIDSRLEAVADWKEPYRQGVVYYLKNRRVRGVLLWNTWGQVDAARGLIAEPGPLTAQDLKGRITG
jgi:3-phenylpropionate/trans-cinnamate dioxygenase ferredoxin reductase subunit